MLAFRNRIDDLVHVTERGEGILSASVAPSATREFDAIVDEVGFLVECGLDQLLMIFCDPEARGVAAGMAPAEIRALKAGTGDDLYRDASLDCARAVRVAFPHLPIIFSTSAQDIICYGRGRFLARCREVGVDAVDTPDYAGIEDPLGLVEASLASQVHYIYSVFQPKDVAWDDGLARRAAGVIERSAGEVFAVPGDSGATKALDGKAFEGTVSFIRRIASQRGIDPRIIAISGINTPEDVRQMTHVAGADGVHFSSAYLNRVAQGMPRGEIAFWLRAVKDAMRR